MRQVRGGVGDFLQIIDQALDYQSETGQDIIACSHFSKSNDFFRSIGLKSKQKKLNHVDNSIPFFKYKKYQKFKLPKTKQNPPRGLNYFGIHPVGSSFSNTLYSNNNLPKKKNFRDY